MIETKITRYDFLADKNKKFRKDPSLGIGKYRYYACPKGLIKIEELPEKWGLIEVLPKNARAEMPKGYGGIIWNAKKDTRDPQYGTRKGYDSYGSREKEDFSFGYNFELEAQYLYALATRYKQQNFMKNIL